MNEQPETPHSDSEEAEAKKGLRNSHEVVKAYRRYGRLYNLVFGPVMEPGRKQALKIMDCQPEQKILELGVGTGLALPYYPRDVRITGIDVSSEMLRQARETIDKYEMQNVELLQMDAQDLQFADDSYEKVAVMYVASVVPDPKKMMEEVKRVCRPDGDIFVLNHFASRKKVVRGFEKIIAPLANVVGFHSDFDMDRFLDDSGIELRSITRVNAFGYWKLLHFRNRQVDETPASAAQGDEWRGREGE